MDIEANKVGGDFIAPDATTAAKKFILSARTMMYAAKDGELIKRAIEGADSLVDGTIPMIAMVMGLVEEKIGPLSPEDERVVAAHLAGTIVEIAQKMGEPESQVEEGRMAVEAITEGVIEVIAGAQEMPVEDPMQDQAMDPTQAPMQPPQDMQLLRSSRNG